MLNKFILRVMKIGKRELILAAVLFCYSLLLRPLYVGAEMCTAIDFNKPTLAISPFGEHAVGLKEDGSLVAAGSRYGNISNWTHIKAIAAGYAYTVGLKEDGTVLSAGGPNVSDWTNIKAIAAGVRFTIGLKEDGTVVGTNWTNIKSIAAGNYHAVGLKEDGTVVAAGESYYGALNVSDWTHIKAISAGYEYTLGLKENGTVVAAGAAPNVSDWTHIKAIAAGFAHAVGLKEDGTVVVAGDIAWFVEVNVSDWTDITAIAAGPNTTMGLKADGTVVITGDYDGSLNNVSNWSTIRQPGCANQIPLANAGPDQVVECADPSGALVTLDGSASSDPDGDPLTYTWTWPSGSAEGLNPTVQLPLGTTEVTLSVSDGKSTATDTVSVTVRDTIPPLTSVTGGNGDWYNTNVISTFSASDSCSGVKEIHYTENGSETVTPGSYATATLTADGIYNISYFAVDNAGNYEASKTMTVKIDKTPPTVSINTNSSTLWPPDHKLVDVLVGGDATDALSGLGAVIFTVRDEYGTVQPAVSGFNTIIPLEAWREGTDKDGRRYTITATATDAAGNKSVATTGVVVPHDQR